MRDSFVCKRGQDNRIVMIACISPCHKDADHTNNTLKYADRLNEREKLKLDIDIELTFDQNED